MLMLDPLMNSLGEDKEKQFSGEQPTVRIKANTATRTTDE